MVNAALFVIAIDSQPNVACSFKHRFPLRLRVEKPPDSMKHAYAGRCLVRDLTNGKSYPSDWFVYEKRH